MASLPLARSVDFFDDPIDAALEMGAYERLWMESGASFRTLADRFARNVGARPSDLVDEGEARHTARQGR